MKKIQMRTMFVALAAGLVMTTATIIASAGHGGPGHPGGPHGDGPDGGPFAALDLSDAQKEQMKALHEQFRESHSSQFEQMKALHEQMHEQRANGDVEGAKATREKIQAVRESLDADRQALHQQMDAILTDAQKAKLEELRPKGEGRGKCKGKCKKGDNPDAEGATQNANPGLD